MDCVNQVSSLKMFLVVALLTDEEAIVITCDSLDEAKTVEKEVINNGEKGELIGLIETRIYEAGQIHSCQPQS